MRRPERCLRRAAVERAEHSRTPLTLAVDDARTDHDLRGDDPVAAVRVCELRDATQPQAVWREAVTKRKRWRRHIRALGF